MSEVVERSVLLSSDGHVVVNAGAAPFQYAGERAKGLSFHPRLPLLLASYHDGSILSWNLTNGSIDREFRGSCATGATRAVDFHPDGTHFASCGDDFAIQLWRFDSPYPMYNLCGHLDYVRTVSFHPRLPLLLSSSDDHTVRIWDWQQRCCVGVAVGHNHYAMCARWSPHYDMVASASLDTSVKLWNISAILQAYNSDNDRVTTAETLAKTVNANIKLQYTAPAAHTRGVNWVACHPTKHLLASAADDKTIAIFTYDDNKAAISQIISSAHTNNVSSVTFANAGGLDALFSVSEDSSLRCFAFSGGEYTRSCKHVRQRDRGWVVTQHPSFPLTAVGYDSGIKLFNVSSTATRDLSPILTLTRPERGGHAPTIVCAVTQELFSHAAVPPAPPAFQSKVLQLSAEDVRNAPTLALKAADAGATTLSSHEWSEMQRIKRLSTLEICRLAAVRSVKASKLSLIAWLCILGAIAFSSLDVIALTVLWIVTAVVWTAISVFQRTVQARMLAGFKSRRSTAAIIQQLREAQPDFFVTHRVLRQRGPSGFAQSVLCSSSTVNDTLERTELGVASCAFFPPHLQEVEAIPTANTVVYLRPHLVTNNSALAVNVRDCIRAKGGAASLCVTLDNLPELNRVLQPSGSNRLVLNADTTWLTSTWAYFVFALLNLGVLQDIMLDLRLQHVEIPCIWYLQGHAHSSENDV